MRTSGGTHHGKSAVAAAKTMGMHPESQLSKTPRRTGLSPMGCRQNTEPR